MRCICIKPVGPFKLFRIYDFVRTKRSIYTQTKKSIYNTFPKFKWVKQSTPHYIFSVATLPKYKFGEVPVRKHFRTNIFNRHFVIVEKKGKLNTDKGKQHALPT